MKPKSHKYGNASQVKCYADGGEVSRTKKKAAKKKTSRVRTDARGNVQSESVGSASDTIRNRRAQQMEALGLRDGGSVKKKMKRSKR